MYIFFLWFPGIVTTPKIILIDDFYRKSIIPITVILSLTIYAAQIYRYRKSASFHAFVNQFGRVRTLLGCAFIPFVVWMWVYFILPLSLSFLATQQQESEYLVQEIRKIHSSRFERCNEVAIKISKDLGTSLCISTEDLSLVHVGQLLRLKGKTLPLIGFYVDAIEIQER